MKKLQDINQNTRTYWNIRYQGNERRKQYEEESGNTRFLRALDEVKEGDKVVDMGCGIGTFTRLVKGYYPQCEVWGTDISDQAMTQNTLENPQIKYLHQYIGNQTELPNDYFDVVFSGETLEHLDDPNSLFTDAKRVLKTGGKLVITTPNGSAIQSPEHMYEFTHEDIEKLYKDNGFVRLRFVYLNDMEHLRIIFAIGRKL